MTVQEFSLEFELLYNNIMSNQAPGLNEYEKSIFLTEAQEALVQEIYSGQTSGGFENTEEMRAYLASLVKQAELVPEEGGVTLGDKSVTATLPDDVWYVVFEQATVDDSSLECCSSTERTCDVYPVSHDTFYRTYNSPFRGANERRVLRLNNGGNTMELVSKYPVTKYLVRYVRRPDPIILVDLEDGLTVNGQTGAMTCMLHEALHRAIVSRAVTIAKTVWSSGQAAEAKTS